MSDTGPLTDARGGKGIVRRGLMFVLSSPSGAGKTSIARALQERDGHIEMSISVTTRPPRPGETDSRDYHFVDDANFRDMVKAGHFLECARVFGHRYGTPREPVMKALAEGRDILFDVDWQGTQQIAQRARQDLVSVFILPPSHQELENRLRRRAQDPEDVVRRRMAKAAAEMSHWAEYDYIVVNANFDTSVSQVHDILHGERLRRERQTGLAEFVAALSKDAP